MTEILSRLEATVHKQVGVEPPAAFLDAYGLAEGGASAASLSAGNTRIAEASAALTTFKNAEDNDGSGYLRFFSGLGGAMAAYSIGGNIPLIKAAFPEAATQSVSGLGISLGVIGMDLAHVGYDVYALSTGKRNAAQDLCMDIGGTLGAGASLWMARGVGGGFGLGLRTFGMSLLGEAAGAAVYHAFDHSSK